MSKGTTKGSGRGRGRGAGTGSKRVSIAASEEASAEDKKTTSVGTESVDQPRAIGTVMEIGGKVVSRDDPGAPFIILAVRMETVGSKLCRQSTSRPLQSVQLIVDSGAAPTVCPQEFAADHGTESEEQTQLQGSGGISIAHIGIRTIRFRGQHVCSRDVILQVQC